MGGFSCASLTALVQDLEKRWQQAAHGLDSTCTLTLSAPHSSGQGTLLLFAGILKLVDFFQFCITIWRLFEISDLANIKRTSLHDNNQLEVKWTSHPPHFATVSTIPCCLTVALFYSTCITVCIRVSICTCHPSMRCLKCYIMLCCGLTGKSNHSQTH